ncbi:alpha/beta fold hydrolase [Rhizobium leguminosarum]|uniref:alpha/beta fold hydrolase n=1 Tax=Rhizobium leguminosarum TaxID=384 RepID=UPI0004919CD5|nr:alpha/beta hydrolase [Rhizobium leguminosarum]
MEDVRYEYLRLADGANLLCKLMGSGAGALCIFVHGLSGDKDGPAGLFDFVGREICRQHPEISVLAFDFAPFGGSFGGPISFASMADQLQCLIELRGPLFSDIFVIAFSVGSVVSLCAISRLASKLASKVKGIFVNSDFSNSVVISEINLRGGEIIIPTRFMEERSLFDARLVLGTRSSWSALLYSEDDKRAGEFRKVGALFDDVVPVPKSDHLFLGLEARTYLSDALSHIIEKHAISGADAT